MFKGDSLQKCFLANVFKIASQSSSDSFPNVDSASYANFSNNYHVSNSIAELRNDHMRNVIECTASIRCVAKWCLSIDQRAYSVVPPVSIT